MGESGYSLVNSRRVPHRMTFAQQNLLSTLGDQREN